MKVDFGFVDHKQVRVGRTDDVGKELAPDLEPGADPVQLSVNARFAAEHYKQRTFRTLINLGSANLHFWPSFLD